MSRARVEGSVLRRCAVQIGLVGLIFISLACGGGRGLRQQNSAQPTSPAAAAPTTAPPAQPAASSADQSGEALEKSLGELEKAIDEMGTLEPIK